MWMWLVRSQTKVVTDMISDHYVILLQDLNAIHANSRLEFMQAFSHFYHILLKTEKKKKFANDTYHISNKTHISTQK